MAIGFGRRLSKRRTSEATALQVPVQASGVGVVNAAAGCRTARRLVETGLSCLAAVLFGGDVGETVGVNPEAEDAVVGHADDVTVVVEPDVAQPDAAHVAAVAGGGRKAHELIAVEAIEPVPGGNPQQPVAVGEYLGGMSLQVAVELVVVVQLMARLSLGFR